MFENVDGRTDGQRTDGRTTDAGVTGILIAHLGAFGSGELKILAYMGFFLFSLETWNFSLALPPEALVNTSGQVLFSSPVYQFKHVFCVCSKEPSD